MTPEEFKIISKDCPWHGRATSCAALQGGFCSERNCAIVYWLQIHIYGVKSELLNRE